MGLHRKWIALFIGALMVVPGAAKAEGPGIYSHPLPRQHSVAECMRRAHLIARANPQMALASDTSSLLLRSRIEEVSYNIRCDLEGWTMFIVAGGVRDIAEHMRRLHRAYRNS